MHTLVQTPQQIFTLPQHLTVPLFQRPYVWTEEDQLAPLWTDIRRLTELRMRPGTAYATHFLGAVVLQQQLSNVGAVSAFAVIDGQQRLTTLQLLMDAAAEVLVAVGQHGLSQQLYSLTHNPDHFGLAQDELLKVQHTNKDRAAFHEVMNAPAPVDYDSLEHQASLVCRAHAFFSEEVRSWLLEDEASLPQRAAQLVNVISTGLQLVTITLQPDENSQEIFETLNARGTPLTAADLIKNLVFQRIEAEGGSAQDAYTKRWSLFEHGFWEHEIGLGRYQVSRISLFLNHWLVARTGEEIGPRSTFNRFKTWVEHESGGQSMSEVLDTLHTQARLYQSWIEAAARRDGSDLDEAALFVYRTQAAKLEVVKPVLLWLYDVHRAISDQERQRSLAAVESWIMRRALLRLPTNDLGRTVSLLIDHLNRADPGLVGQRTEEFLSRQRRRGTYWPGDEQLRREIPSMPAYRRYPRSLLRMFLETVEDVERGHAVGQQLSKSGIRIPRHTMAIEHLLPQRWRTNWPVDGGLAAEIRRDEHVHRLGNLTLLTSSLNSTLSNAPWLGPGGKRAALHKHDVILMNRRIRDTAQDSWTEEDIDRRTSKMLEAVLQVWRVPEGHLGLHDDGELVSDENIDLRDLLAAGVLNVGDVLTGRVDSAHKARIGEEGVLHVDGSEFRSLTAAAKHLRGKVTNGWWYFLAPNGRALRDLRREYARSLTSRLPVEAGGTE